MPTTRDAVAASVACAARLGLPTDNPVVVSEGYSVRVRLDPAPVLTRVVTVGRILRGDPMPWMQREVAVTRYLSSVGAAVVPPWHEPGPHVANGLEVSLWQWFEPEPVDVPPTDFARMLADLHEALSGYQEELPLLVGPLTDIRSALTTQDDAVLHEAAQRLLPLAETWPTRPLHGDAHTGNVLTTAAGRYWMDFEDVCAGPLEWDLASRTISDEVVDAYPADIDPARLEQCRELRRLQVLALVLTDDLQDAGLYEELTAALRI